MRFRIKMYGFEVCDLGFEGCRSTSITYTRIAECFGSASPTRNGLGIDCPELRLCFAMNPEHMRPGFVRVVSWLEFKKLSSKPFLF